MTITTTLPTLTETLDNAFLSTWYEIRAEAIDNILNATVLWAALNAAGCMVPQEGGDLITRTLSYDYQAATSVQRGDTLPQGEKETETMARWTFRHTATHVQRDIFKDRENRGPSKIKDYVGQRLTAARDGLEQQYEANLFNTIVTAETGKEMQGVHDMVPPIASRTTGTYGQIARPASYVDSGNGVFVGDGANGWWGPKYLAGTLASVEDDLLDDMKKLYNTVHNNQSPPNLILGTQKLFEIYETFGLDISQIIKDENTKLVDLGFEVLRFKGKPFIWSSRMTTDHLVMLNTNYVELVYDPGLWFDMTEWKPMPLSSIRIAHIMCAANMVSSQLRRHGRLEYA